MSTKRPSLLDEGEFGTIGSKKGSSGGGGGLRPDTIKLLVAGGCLALAFGFLGYRYVYAPWAERAAMRANRNPADDAKMEEQFEEQKEEFELLNKEIEQQGA